MILESILVVAMLWLAVGVLFGILPWMTKLIAIYAIHGLRDRMFKLYRTYPSVHRSLLYRDLDALLAMSLHVVREHRYQDCAALLPRPGVESIPTWRRERYREERLDVFGDERGREVLNEFTSITTRLALFLMFRVVTGHPGMLLLTILSAPFVVAHIALSSAVTRAESVDDIESAIMRIDDRPSGTGLQALRQLFRGPDTRAAA